MKLITWNVNGFRAVLKKGFEDFFYSQNADVFAIQETKMQEGQADFAPDGYDAVYNSALKKGYSGTAVFYSEKLKERLIDIRKGINGLHNDEGRVITMEFDSFYLLMYGEETMKALKEYTPGGATDLRQEKRMQDGESTIL